MLVLLDAPDSAPSDGSEAENFPERRCVYLNAFKLNRVLFPGANVTFSCSPVDTGQRPHPDMSGRCQNIKKCATFTSVSALKQRKR